MSNNSPILVTGATGFIGRAVCAALLAQGFPVRAVVRNDSVTKESIPASEVAVIDDINRNTDWSNPLANVDTVIHLAAWNNSVEEVPINPLAACREINVYGSERLAKMAAASGVRRFIYMGSVKVHGEGDDHAYTEEDEPRPQNLYVSSKWQAEQLLQIIAGQTDMELVILRPPLVYGPGVKVNFLRLMKLVDKQIPLPLAGIKNKRSIIYVGNLVDAVIKCIRHPEASGKTFLVSDVDDVSTKELIGMIAAALKKKPYLFYLPESLLKLAGKIAGREAEIKRLCDSLYIDMSKIKTALNWTPPFSSEEGIRQTTRWYKNK
jgi:nucleoside-diphosphate-sugar epimerase